MKSHNPANAQESSDDEDAEYKYFKQNVANRMDEYIWGLVKQIEQ